MKKLAMVSAVIMIFMLSSCSNSSSGSNISVSSASSVSSAASSSMPLQESSSVPVPVSAGESMRASQLPTSQIPSSQSATDIESRKAPENVDESYLAGLGNLSGAVLEVNSNGFSFEGGTPEVSANGAYATLITDSTIDIVYTDQSIFLFAEYEKATDESTVYMGSVEDVAPGRSVTVWGEYEGDNFVAAAVRVVVFV